MNGIPSENIDVDKKKRKKKRNRIIKIVAAILALTLIVTEVGGRWATGAPAVVGMDQQSLMRAQVTELLENSKKVTSAYEDVERLIEEEKYGEALEKVDYMLEELTLERDEEMALETVQTALYFANGEFAKARAGCDKLIEDGRDTDGYYYFMSAVCDVQEEKYGSAKDKLLEALNREYSSPSLCYVHLALCENYLENFENVLDYVTKANETGVDEIYKYTLLYLQTIASLRLEQFEDTITYATTLLEHEDYKEDGELYYFKGVSEMTLERYDEAYADFESAMKFNTNEAIVTSLYYNLGVTALGLENAEDAIKNLSKVVERADDEDLKTASEELLETLQTGTEVEQ